MAKSIISDEYEDKCRVIYNGIDVKMIRRKDGSYNDSKINLIQVSNLLHQYKGQDVLIKAMNILILKRRVKTFYLTLVGEGTSRIYLENMIENYNLNDFVLLLGNKSRACVYQNLCNYDVLVQPSRNEGFGLTIVEGMIARIPVVTSDIDGPIEIIENGLYGFSFANENEEELADQIYFVSCNLKTSEMNEKIGMAYNRALELFDIKQTAQKYIQEYELCAE